VARSPESSSLPGRWAAALTARGPDSTTLRAELAAAHWYPSYAFLRASGLDADTAASRVETALTHFIEEEDTAPESAPLLRQRLLEHTQHALAEADARDPLLAVDREWAADRFAQEGPHAPEEIFARRWTLLLIESALAGLDHEYAAAGHAEWLTALQPFLGYSGEAGAEGNYAHLSAQLGLTDGAARKAVYDLRTRYRELLRTAIADTVARTDQIDSELATLLSELPPPAASVGPLSILGRIDPKDLLTRAVHHPRVSSDGARGWAPLALAEVTRLLPQYEVTALLGHGGMGAVYAGRQVALDRRVAIKFLPLEISVEQNFVDRFIREARAMARLEHPNIIGVHDFGQTTEGHLYFVMEFVDGATLHQIIHAPPEGETTAGAARRRGSAVAPDLALSFVAQVCDALHYAHEEGIIHRDIKPANVLVDRRGRVKVADFGLARLTGGPAPDSGLTVSGTVMGTPDYMAPEQRGGFVVDHRADIYSVGVMLYESLTGDLPRGLFKAASQKAPGIDPRLDGIIGRALSAEPEERYQSSTEMKRDLDAVRSGPVPVAVAAPTPAGRESGRTPLRRRAPLYAGLATTVVLGLSAWFLRSAQTDLPAPTTAEIAASGRVGVPPAGEGVPPSRTSDPAVNANPADTLAPPPTDRSGETPKPAGGTPALPAPEIASAPAPVPSPATPAPAPPPENLLAKVEPAKPELSGTTLPIATATAPTSTPLATPIPTVTPKPPSEMEAWLAKVDAPQQEAFQRDVVKPFETAVAEQRTRYLAALDAAIARASTAGKLDEALALRTDRQSFEQAQGVPPDDSDSPVATVKPLRTAYRANVARLDQERLTKAKAAHAKYDAFLTQSQTTLTQRHRLDDALLLKTKREEVQKAWLKSAGAPAPPAATPAATQPAPGSDGALPFTAKPGATPAPKPAATPATVRETVEWILSVGGEVAYEDSGKEVWIKQPDEIPKGRFEVTNVQLVQKGAKWKADATEADFQRLGVLRGLKTLGVHDVRVGDGAFAFLSEFRDLARLELTKVPITDSFIDQLTGLQKLKFLTVGWPSADFTGKTCDKLAKLPKLEQLTFPVTSITDDGLAVVAKLNLAVLELMGSPALTDAGVVHLSRMKSLRYLDLTGCNVTIKGVSALKDLKSLKSIGYLDGRSPDFANEAKQFAAVFPLLETTRIIASLNAEQVRELAAFRELKALRLQYVRFSDDAIAELHVLPKLEDLDFGRAELNDAGLLQLKPLKKLRSVRVPGTQVTEAAARALEKAIPGCKVTR